MCFQFTLKVHRLLRKCLCFAYFRNCCTQANSDGVRGGVDHLAAMSGGGGSDGTPSGGATGRGGAVAKWLVATLVACGLVVQYSYTSVFEARRPIDPLFVVNSSSASVGRRFFWPVLTNRSGRAGWADASGYQMIDNRPLVDQNGSDINGPRELCPIVSPHLLGPFKPAKEAPPTLDELERELALAGALPAFGGQWQPATCRSRDRVALIIPYRDRAAHLRVFLKNMHPFLQRQQISYGIFIVEQAGDGPFNRAMLMNVGAVEAQALGRGRGGVGGFDCYIFHDIDLLPEDDRNIYNCPDQPRHMSVAIDVLQYRLPYADIFGGVSALSRKHFEQVNGFSNVYWGWGGEDDDMSTRLRTNGLHITRYPPHIARYIMLKHRKQKANPKRYEMLYMAKNRYKSDGLNSLQYRRVALRENRSLTWMLVELGAPS
ncbi:beta-1,4-N-acetylgalactosaminyltransferase bre-4-like [Nilaparvata lugens]|uniref:beta-1,4-N-acetylgalactosaminyltransferase bre-4-like n=1 Tax=Nilaparvata lugens TaxID=108931 RepID=UPI00193CFDCD|nr:beta-1,4-N-acetylgalactosaminyltransferase bre-4-like [Nilaparvata lugens]